MHAGCCSLPPCSYFKNTRSAGDIAAMPYGNIALLIVFVRFLLFRLVPNISCSLLHSSVVSRFLIAVCSVCLETVVCQDICMYQFQPLALLSQLVFENLPSFTFPCPKLSIRHLSRPKASPISAVGSSTILISWFSCLVVHTGQMAYDACFSRMTFFLFGSRIQTG